MTLNRVKLGRAVTFIKYFDGEVSLMFLVKSLIWNKITFLETNSLKQRFQEPITQKLDNFTKILISVVFD